MGHNDGCKEIHGDETRRGREKALPAERLERESGRSLAERQAAPSAVIRRRLF